MSRSWSSAHDWKSCRGQKLLESSNLSNSAKKKEPAAGRFFLFAFGEIRILIEGPGGAFIVQCAHWTIPLFCFPISREKNKMQANLSNSASCANIVLRSRLAAKTAYPLSPSSFSKSDPLRWAPIWVWYRKCTGTFLFTFSDTQTRRGN